MDYNAYMKEKLSKVLFIEIKMDGFLKLINYNGPDLNLSHDIFFPVKVERLSEEIKKDINASNLSISYLVEGMFLTIGIDKDFRFNNDYKKVLKVIKESEGYVKGIVADLIKGKHYLDAFCLLRGLTRFNGCEDYYDKLLTVGQKLLELDKEFIDIQYEAISDAKNELLNSPVPYYYETLAHYSEGETAQAYVAIHEYLNKGGEKDSTISNLLTILGDDDNYSKGIELLDSNPKKALEYLLKVYENNNDDAILNFYIGLTYRKLELYEKAIYYLNESIRLDSSIVEAINEMGINYACIGNNEEAVKYLRKAFEATKDVEVCTNLIICYYNMGDMENAKLHLELAEKIDKDDEVVQSLIKLLRK